MWLFRNRSGEKGGPKFWYQYLRFRKCKCIYSYYFNDISNIQSEFNKITNHINGIQIRINNSTFLEYHKKELKANLNILNYNYKKVESKIGNFF